MAETVPPTQGRDDDQQGAGALDTRMKPQGIAPPWFREGKDTLNNPKELPNASTLNVWLAKVATVLTGASVYYDKAEVESWEDSGEPRFNGLDSMLATALQAQVKS